MGGAEIHTHMGVSKNRGIMENPIKMDDLGVPLSSETAICTMVKSHSKKGNGHPTF